MSKTRRKHLNARRITGEEWSGQILLPPGEGGAKRRMRALTRREERVNEFRDGGNSYSTVDFRVLVCEFFLRPEIRSHVLRAILSQRERVRARGYLRSRTFHPGKSPRASISNE